MSWALAQIRVDLPESRGQAKLTQELAGWQAASAARRRSSERGRFFRSGKIEIGAAINVQKKWLLIECPEGCSRAIMWLENGYVYIRFSLRGLQQGFHPDATYGRR
jgi:hypothetical protein